MSAMGSEIKVEGVIETPRGDASSLEEIHSSVPTPPPSAGQETADERRPMTENEIFVTLMARMVLAALTLCWLALCAYMFHIFEVH